MKNPFAAIFTSLYLLFSLSLGAQLNQSFVEEEIGEGWLAPVQIKFDASGRGYVLERSGKVWILDEEGQKLDEPLVDISEEVAFFGDHGAMSITLHPNFLSNGYFYLLYTVDRHHLLHFGTPEYDPAKTITEQATIARITRFTADVSADFTKIVPGSRKVLLGDRIENGFPVLMVSHGAGSLVFGTDGTLLASCGDAGSFQRDDMGSAPETYYAQALEDGIIRPKENIGSFRAQLIDCLNGKIIRIDPETGLGIPGNPFFDSTDPASAASKVYALGFRQPFRFVVRPGTGSHNPEDGDPGVLYVGDVGSSLFEELNVVIAPGQNFGWPVFEGYDYKYPFNMAELQNPDAVNVHAATDCPYPYFRFIDLLKQVHNPQPLFYNPCDSSLLMPEETDYFIHALPSIAWSNEKYNPPTRALIANFDEAGKLSPIDIEDPLSAVAGKNFEGSSSIPGFFYTEENFPEKYRDKFFICDFSGWIRVMDFDKNNNLSEVDSFHTDIEFIVDMAVNPVNGALYMVNLFHSIHKIQYGGNVPPKAVITADKQYGASPLTVQFDASASLDANGDPLSFSWDFGDGQSSQEESPLHVFDAGGGQPASFLVKLTATDTAGGEGEAQLLISPNNSPPVVRITSPKDSLLYALGGTNYIPLKADVTDAESNIEGLAYTWQWFLHHNDHYHPEFPIEDRESVAAITPVGCNGEDYYYRVRLDVEDPQGLAGSDEVFLYPYCGTPIAEEILLTGRAEKEGVFLEWTDGDIVDPLKYEIQRGLKFDHLGVIKELDPNMLDYHDAQPPMAELAYRIKAYRSDGVYAYSNLLYLDYPPPPEFTLLPNPVRSQLRISMPGTKSDRLNIEVFDPSGKLMLEDSWWHTKVTDPFEAMLDVSVLPNGMYFYIFYDGARRYDGVFVVAR